MKDRRPSQVVDKKLEGRLVSFRSGTYWGDLYWVNKLWVERGLLFLVNVGLLLKVYTV